MDLSNKNQILRISDGCETYCLRTHDYYASQQRDSFSFAPISGKKYYFNFNVQNYNLTDSNKFVLNCNSKYKNRQQESAELLACGEYKIDFKDAPPMLENQCNATTYNSLLWYYFIGNDSVMQITGNSSDVRVEVMDENCNFLHVFNFGNNLFQTEKGKKYYLRVNNYYSYASPITYTFDVDYECIIDATEDLSGDLYYYPNPFLDKLTIDCRGSATKYHKAEISNINGIVVMNQALYELKTELDLKHILPGVYLLKLYNDDHSIIRKIIKME